MKTKVQQDNEVGRGKKTNPKNPGKKKSERNAIKDLVLKIITFRLSRKNRAA